MLLFRNYPDNILIQARDAFLADVEIKTALVGNSVAWRVAVKLS